MKTLALILLASLALASLACGDAPPTAGKTQTAATVGEPGQQQTPVPATSATTPTDILVFPGTATLPTPTSSSETMGLTGSVWVDARPATGEVLGFINGQQCGKGQSIVLASDPPNPVPSFTLGIASGDAQRGCGVLGAAVTITINGRAVNDTVPWQPGFQQPVFLVAGPEFAIYYGTLKMDPGLPPPMRLLPYIDGTVCGQTVAGGFMPEDDVWWYQVVVDPEKLRPGCGRSGVNVEFRLEVEGQGEIELGTSAWEPLPTVQRPPTLQRPALDLTDQIRMTPVPTDAAAP